MNCYRLNCHHWQTKTWLPISPFHFKNALSLKVVVSSQPNQETDLHLPTEIRLYKQLLVQNFQFYHGHTLHQFTAINSTIQAINAVIVDAIYYHTHAHTVVMGRHLSTSQPMYQDQLAGYSVIPAWCEVYDGRGE